MFLLSMKYYHKILFKMYDYIVLFCFLFRLFILIICQDLLLLMLLFLVLLLLLLLTLYISVRPNDTEAATSFMYQ